MADYFTVESTDFGASLTLRPCDRHYFFATVHHPGLDATARVGSYMSGGIADFFAGLAESWKGWTGKRTWGSLEGELKLNAESDRTGHVRVRVSLRDGAPPRWEVELDLIVEAGQLEMIASEARSFERSALSATE
jgi:hypothetical protein